MARPICLQTQYTRVINAGNRRQGPQGAGARGPGGAAGADGLADGAEFSPSRSPSPSPSSSPNVSPVPSRNQSPAFGVEHGAAGDSGSVASVSLAAQALGENGGECLGGSGQACSPPATPTAKVALHLFPQLTPAARIACRTHLRLVFHRNPRLEALIYSLLTAAVPSSSPRRRSRLPTGTTLR